jgi:hypothetical protein
MTKHPPGGKSMANRTYLPASDISRRFERRRADRERAKKASGEWLQISEIISAVVKKEDATFDDNKRNKIAIEVCGRIVSDSSDGKLGTKRSPALMLLSEDYDEITLKPSELAQNLKNAFDGLNSEKRRQSIATFLTDHFWMRRVAAAKWLGPEFHCPGIFGPHKKAFRKLGRRIGRNA